MPLLVRASHLSVRVECLSTFGIGILGEKNIQQFVHLIRYLHT